MALFLAPIINGQVVDASGNPLNGGKVYVYFAGSSTPSTTYTSQAASTPNSNPIILNTLGVNAAGDVWLSQGAEYKFVIKDSSDVTLRTIDDISGINDNTSVIDQWVPFNTSVPTYVSATSFTVTGDQTQTFQVGTRVKTTNTGGTVLGTVIRSTYSSLTTVVIIPDAGASLDSGLSAVQAGVISASNTSLPGTLTVPPFRNRIINGAFRFDQEHAAASQTIVAAAAIAYTIDQFYCSCTGANVTTQRIAGSVNPYAFKITGAASNTATLFGQRIESFDCVDWVSQQINVQIPISAVGITSVTWNAYVANTTDTFSAKTLLATGTLTLSGTVETKYFSFNAGANAARGIAIEFVTGALVAGQSITYEGAYQAEAGQVSPFERTPVGFDLQRCQRHYCKTFDLGTAPVQFVNVYNGAVITTSSVAGGFRAQWVFPVEMRAVPTVITYNPKASNANWRGTVGAADYAVAACIAIGTRQTDIGAGSSLAGLEIYSIHATASARL